MSDFKFSITVKEIVDAIPVATLVSVPDEWFEEIPKDQGVFDAFYAYIADHYDVGEDWFPPNCVYVGSTLMNKLLSLVRQKMKKRFRLSGDELERSVSWTNIAAGPLQTIHWDTEIVGPDAFLLPEIDATARDILFSLHMDRVENYNAKIARKAKGHSFFQWILCHTKRDDWIGDTARDIKIDDKFPSNATSYYQVKSYLENESVGDKVIDSMRACWLEYVRKYPKRLHPFAVCNACGHGIDDLPNAILTFGSWFCSWEFYHENCFDHEVCEDNGWVFIRIEDKTIPEIMGLLERRLYRLPGSDLRDQHYEDWLAGMNGDLLLSGIPKSNRSSKRRKKIRTPTVYFIQVEGQNLVKIGYTTSLETRLATLATASASRLKVLFSLEGDREVERELHRRFRHLHVHNEWFHLGDEILAYIEAMDASKNE